MCKFRHGRYPFKLQHSIIVQLKDQEIKRIPVRYSVSPDKQAIRIVSDSGKELSKLEIGANILNF